MQLEPQQALVTCVARVLHSLERERAFAAIAVSYGDGLLAGERIRQERVTDTLVAALRAFASARAAELPPAVVEGTVRALASLAALPAARALVARPGTEGSAVTDAYGPTVSSLRAVAPLASAAEPLATLARERFAA